MTTLTSRRDGVTRERVPVRGRARMRWVARLRLSDGLTVEGTDRAAVRVATLLARDVRYARTALRAARRAESAAKADAKALAGAVARRTAERPAHAMAGAVALRAYDARTADLAAREARARVTHDHAQGIRRAAESLRDALAHYVSLPDAHVGTAEPTADLIDLVILSDGDALVVAESLADAAETPLADLRAAVRAAGWRPYAVRVRSLPQTPASLAGQPTQGNER